MASTKYRLVALDVDGTVAGLGDQVPSETIRAIRALQADGLHVVLATGRSHEEVMPVWRKLKLRPQDSPVIVVGGAMISEPDSGRTLYQKGIAPKLATRFGEALSARGKSLIALVDGWRHGFDYYAVSSGDRESVLRQWFGQMDVRTRWLSDLRSVGDMPRAIRLAALVSSQEDAELEATLSDEFHGELEMHSILAPNYGLQILEAFASGVSKWSALTYLAGGWRIGRGQIAAIGDDINDVRMVREAGMGAAVPSRFDALQDVADVVIDGSLAEFLDELRKGRFDHIAEG